jgi:hypothetical protein
LIKVRKWAPTAVNQLIENSRSNTPADMKPENCLNLFPPRDQITGPIPKGVLTSAEIDEWRRAHRIIPKTEGTAPTTPRRLCPEGRAWADYVKNYDVNYKKNRVTQARDSAASASDTRVTAALTATHEAVQSRTSDPAYPTPALNASRYVFSTPTKSTKLAERRARRLGGDPPE